MESERQVALQGLLLGAGLSGAEVRPLAADASFRSYHRVHGLDGRVLVLMDAPPANEDVRPFVRIAELLRDWGLSAPEVVAEDAKAGFLLLEDLGDDLFSHLIAGDRSMAPCLYTAAIEVLAALHGQQAPSDLPRHDRDVLLSEVALFLDWRFPELHGRPASEKETESFLAAWERVLQACSLSCETLVLRDYHVDNLIWLPERSGNSRVGLLDFQDAVGGDPAYDVASLLSDVRRDIEPALASSMLAHYLEVTGLDSQAFRASLAVLGAQRNMRILGVFTRLWRRDGKPSYTGWLARTWRLVRRDLAHEALAPVRAWVAQHAPQDRQADELERRD
ncbi:MAG: phosphotransferase [Minwuia sp.]|nr:phosphotransferase [Minwuia sp.]